MGLDFFEFGCPIPIVIGHRAARLKVKDIALERYKIIEPFLLRQATLQQISKKTQVAVRTLYNWVSAFKTRGLEGLTPKPRIDKGRHRATDGEIADVIRGMSLRTPPVPISAIHRTVKGICEKNGWRVPSYDVVHELVSEIPPHLKTLAHEGVKAYKHAFGLIHRFEAERPNEIWQADHAMLDILILDSKKVPRKPWLTVIVDDYSRSVPGYFLGFDPPSSIRIALALRQAIWRKKDQNWLICGIPEKLYSDCGSDFMSKHIEQVAIDLKFETIQTEPNEPQGKGKCERIFQTITSMFLCTLPGYAPEAHVATAKAALTLEQLDERFKAWLVSEYLVRKHSETGAAPKDRWESYPFVPRLPESLDELDLLLLTVGKVRRVQRDGIRFSGFRYSDIALSGHVGEDVTIRFDPRDLSEIHVYLEDRLICRASCDDLSGKRLSLKEVIHARNHEAKEHKQRLNELLATAEKHAPTESSRAPKIESQSESSVEYPKFKIKRFACDKD